MPENDLNKIEIRSEEIQDILGQVPRWIVRWGTIVVLVTVLVLLAFSWIFEYPEIIRADIRVTTENPPAPLKARVDGQIEEWFAVESTNVKAGTHLVVIENPAVYSDVISLRFDVAGIQTILNSLDDHEIITLNNNYSLGDIQSSYAEFISAYQDYYQFLALDSHAKTIQSKDEQIQQIKSHINQLKRQSKLLMEDYELATRQYLRMDTLLKGEAIAPAELDRARQEEINKGINYEKSLTEISEKQSQILILQQDKGTLELTRQQDSERKRAAIREAFEKLKSQVEIWEQNYLLEAPVDGLVSQNKIYHENQNVREGETVITIIPEDPGEIIGKIDLGIRGSGKVNIGDPVNIQFANFPYLEYGMVRGIIRSISLVPDNEIYTVEVDLPNGLITYYDREIPFNQEMLGRAEIITDDRRLLERIFSPIKSIFSEQKAGRED